MIPMPNWKRLIVGDAFKLTSRELTYYRDLFFVFPFFLYSIAGMFHLLSHNAALAYKFLALATIALLFAKHRLPIVAAVAGFVILRCVLIIPFHWDRQLLLALAVSGAVLLVLIPFLKKYPLAYSAPKGLRVADLLVGVASLGLSLYVAVLIRR